MKRVLFVCTHNSARSQMAEGLLRGRFAGRFHAASAGTSPSRVHAGAVRAMAEVGIDISAQRSKHVDELINDRFDYVITVCDQANEVCPVFPGGRRRLHWSLPDPAQAVGGAHARLAAFRSVRDELARLLEETFGG